MVVLFGGWFWSVGVEVYDFVVVSERRGLQNFESAIALEVVSLAVNG